MKKVLSLVLVLTLVLGSFGFAFADTAKTTVSVASDVEGTAFEDAVTVLTALGVVSGYEDGTYKPANIVTRAEMAKLIIAELGLEGSATGSKSTFKDMSGYGWAEGYVGYAQSLGIISGYGDGTFKPGKTVSYDEALTMMVSALGYTKECKEMNGSWPAIYVQKARVLGLTDDVKAGGAVGANRGDIAIMLYNMLTANMGYADADGVYRSKLDKDENPIKVATNLDVEETTSYELITASDAKDAVVNIRKHVGSVAKTFRMTKGDRDGDIIAISDTKTTFVTGKYDKGDKELETVDGTVYKLDSTKWNPTIKNSKVTSGVDEFTTTLFVNGDRDDKATEAKLKDNTYYTIAAELSGKTVDKLYSVALWTIDGSKGDEALVDADDLKEIKDSQKLLGKEFALDNNDNIDDTSFELIGVASLDDIKADNVVYVYINDDDEISRVAVGTETVSGEVTKVKNGTVNTGDATKITINGKVYKLSNEELNGNGIVAELESDDIDAENEVKLFLDAYGYAYDYEEISGKADNFAIALEAGDGGSGIGADQQIKLFLNDETDKIFNVDSDAFEDYKPANKDGNPAKPYDSLLINAATDKWAAGWVDAPLASAGLLVKYGVDKSGKIDSFDNLDKDDYTFVKATAESAISAKGYYKGKEIKSNAVIFTADFAYDEVSKEKQKEDNYSATTLEKVLDSDDVYADYVLDDGKIVAMLIYNYSVTSDIYGVVDGKAKNNSDAGYEFALWVNGKEVTYNGKNLSVGTNATSNPTLYKVKFDAAGDIKELVDAADAKETKEKGDTWAYAKINVTTKGALSYSGRVLRIVKAGATVQASTVNGKDELGMTSFTLDKNVVVYHNDGSDWETVSASELKSIEGDIYLYDIDGDEDGVYDVVIINEK